MYAQPRTADMQSIVDAIKQSSKGMPFVIRTVQMAQCTIDKIRMERERNEQEIAKMFINSFKNGNICEVSE